VHAISWVPGDLQILSVGMDGAVYQWDISVRAMVPGLGSACVAVLLLLSRTVRPLPRARPCLHAASSLMVRHMLLLLLLL
jgi:hypothetical protein